MVPKPRLASQNISSSWGAAAFNMAIKVSRCFWVSDDPLYIRYHDDDWGVPIGLGARSNAEITAADKIHFEFLILEGAQAGLSWITILRRRAGYNEVYDNFDATKVAQYDEAKVAELLANPGIIRNKLKVRASIKNAQVFLGIQKEFGSFNSYIWGWTDNQQIRNRPKSMADVPATSPLSDSISKDLKKRGMSFVGSTIIYAYLQATGIVDDHTSGCFRFSAE